jgi:hypothetical protein
MFKPSHQNCFIVILDLHFEGPNGGFRDLVSFYHEFTLGTGERLADVVRSIVERWTGGASRLLHSRLVLSDSE